MRLRPDCYTEIRTIHQRGSGWAPVGSTDFNSDGPGPSVGTVGSTPSRSRHTTRATLLGNVLCRLTPEICIYPALNGIAGIPPLLNSRIFPSFCTLLSPMSSTSLNSDISISPPHLRHNLPTACHPSVSLSASGSFHCRSRPPFRSWGACRTTFRQPQSEHEN